MRKEVVRPGCLMVLGAVLGLLAAVPAGAQPIIIPLEPQAKEPPAPPAASAPPVAPPTAAPDRAAGDAASGAPAAPAGQREEAAQPTSK